MVVCAECETLVEALSESGLNPTQTMRDLYNKHLVDSWDEIRDFLALHYKINTRLDTPFWRQCRADTELDRLAPFLKYYEENGPSALGRMMLPREPGSFGVEGYLVMLVGNAHPYRARYQPTDKEWRFWNGRRAEFAATAQQGFDVRQTLAYVRNPKWVWPAPADPATAAPRMVEASRSPTPSFSLG
jgi:tryptophan halogenase